MSKSKTTTQSIVTVFAWWTLISGANLLVDEAASQFLEANQIVGGIGMVVILAAGFLIGEAVAAMIHGREPT
jgi:hypothetical protein